MKETTAGGWTKWSGCLQINHSRFYVLGGDNPNCTTTSEKQAADTLLVTDWDFVDEAENGTENIWWILEGQDYPRFWWEPVGN